MDSNVVWNPPLSSPCDFRFCVKYFPITEPKSQQVLHVSFIYLVDSHGIPILITHLQDYVTESLTRPDPYSSTMEKRCYFFCSMLNYILIENHDRYGISSVLEINHDMMQDFFSDYALDIIYTDEHRTSSVVWRCVRVCTFTMRQILLKHRDRMALKLEDLLVPKQIHDYRGCKKIDYVPNFTAHGHDFVTTPIYREIPTEALELLISLAFKRAPNIVFALCLQAFAGLRPSEVCNVRQECSPLGPGIEFVMGSSNITYPQIDLRRELTLRSDNIHVGGIKKARVQRVYPAFIEAFTVVYEWHKERLAYRKFEEAYAPMFINRDGKAMTYDSYLYQFDNLVSKYFIPALFSSNNTELQQYGHIIKERKLSPHALRHAYTVQLVLRGVSAAELMYWRGDSCITSSATYVANKGELTKLAKQVGADFTQFIVELGKEKRYAASHSID